MSEFCFRYLLITLVLLVSYASTKAYAQTSPSGADVPVAPESVANAGAQPVRVDPVIPSGPAEENLITPPMEKENVRVHTSDHDYIATVTDSTEIYNDNFCEQVVTDTGFRALRDPGRAKDKVKPYLEMAVKTRGGNPQFPYIKHASLVICELPPTKPPGDGSTDSLGDIQLKDGDGNNVTSKQFSTLVTKWLQEKPRTRNLVITGQIITSSKSWGRYEIATLEFRGKNVIADGSLYFSVRRPSNFRLNFEIGNNYVFGLRDSGFAGLLPASLIVGGDFRNAPIKGLEYFGLHAVIAPRLELSENIIKRVPDLFLGFRFDFSGYLAIGAGYSINFAGTNDWSNVSVLISIMPYLFDGLGLKVKADADKQGTLSR